MLMTSAEAIFLRSNIRPTDSVLEWGSGESTIEIAAMLTTGTIVSIEHNWIWYDRIHKRLVEAHPTGASLIIHQSPRPAYDDRHDGDGSAEQFKDYVRTPLTFGKVFDVILIDGRARVACAMMTPRLARPGGIVMIHDWDRPQYSAALDVLNLMSQVGCLAKFQLKSLFK